jgi:hypothetical protein
MTEAFPLQWPVGVPRTSRVLDAAFKVTLGSAIKQVMNEVRLMGGALPVLSTNLELRRDGLPYANQRQPEDCGVAVYFQRRGKSMVFACDRWRKIEHNIRAIAKTLEALRGIERWGSADMVEQAYTGFEALPAPSGGVSLSCWALLDLEPGADRMAIERAYRIKAKASHPDQGGSRDEWDALRSAYEQALAA